MQRFSLDPKTLSREEPVNFAGPAGNLEGLWRPVKPGAALRGAVVVAHPHPAYGGTMLNKVVFHIARVLNHDHDLASLRFNFRGVGQSEGSYDEGRGECEDVAAAWREASRHTGGLPLIAAGFSFGAAMTVFAAANAVEAHRPAGLALAGLPMRLFGFPDPFPHALPVAAAHGEQDQFTPPPPVAEYLDRWPAPHAFHVEPGADHFFEGQLPAVTAFLSARVGEWLNGA